MATFMYKTKGNEKLYELQCNVLGKEHADTLRTKGELQRLIGQN